VADDAELGMWKHMGVANVIGHRPRHLCQHESPGISRRSDGDRDRDLRSNATNKNYIYPRQHKAHTYAQFYSTSLTWSRALNVPLYLNALDEEWYQRKGSLKDDDRVVFWREKVELGPNVTVIECGG